MKILMIIILILSIQLLNAKTILNKTTAGNTLKSTNTDDIDYSVDIETFVENGLKKNPNLDKKAYRQNYEIYQSSEVAKKSNLSNERELNIIKKTYYRLKKSLEKLDSMGCKKVHHILKNSKELQAKELQSVLKRYNEFIQKNCSKGN